MAGLGPQVVQVLDFAAARAPELQAQQELARHADLRSVVDEKLVTQRNQRRRRANAFKSHKMPRRLRNQAATGPASRDQEEEHIALGTDGSKPADSKRLGVGAGDKAAKARAKRESKPRCRKHRRRMHLLLEEHSWVAAQKPDGDCDEEAAVEVPKWLPTHAWHAKRMLMRERYGYMLPQRRQDKSISAALTALRKTATLHDASYYGVLELYGLDELLLEVLQVVSDPSGSQFDDRRFFKGEEEGCSVLYHPNQFPSGAIAPVTFMWRPISEHDDGAKGAEDEEPLPRKRQLWIWIHPAAFMEAANAIADACQEVMSERDGSESIEILDRRGHLARLQLRGKSAESILHNVLKEAEVAGTDDMADDSDHDDGYSATSFRELFSKSNPSNLQVILKKAREGDSGRRIRSVYVQDPRLRSASHSRNQNRTQASRSELSLLKEPSADMVNAASSILCPLSGLHLAEDNAEEPDSELILTRLESLIQWTTKSREAWDPTSDAVYPYVPRSASPASTDANVEDVEPSSTRSSIPVSPLWSLSGRGHVHRKFMKDHEINESRDGASVLVSSVPVLLVREHSAFPCSSGLDLIIGPEYAPAFLNAFVFSGAMVIGLEEYEALATTILQPSFPRDFPDTAACRNYWDQLANELESEHIKKPKAKRVNYEKLGVESPFQPNWELLFQSVEGCSKPGDGEDYDEQMEPPMALCVLRVATYMEPFPFYPYLDSAIDEDDHGGRELVPVAVPTLIRVAVSLPRRGNLESCSLLYQPRAGDVARFREDSKWNGYELDGRVAQEELELVGFVTSAVYDRPKSSFRGTAFCACDTLQRLAVTQRDGTSKTLLAMTRTPTSRQLRPVLIHVQA